jgi:hypothetical protein
MLEPAGAPLSQPRINELQKHGFIPLPFFVVDVMTSGRSERCAGSVLLELLSWVQSSTCHRARLYY